MAIRRRGHRGRERATTRVAPTPIVIRARGPIPESAGMTVGERLYRWGPVDVVRQAHHELTASPRPGGQAVIRRVLGREASRPQGFLGIV